MGNSTRSRHALRTACYLATAVAVLGIFASANGLTDHLQSRTLRDGTRVTLEAVTFGNREVVRGVWWRKALYYLLPPALKSRTGCRVYRGPGANSLTVHLQVRGPAVARSRNPMGFSSTLETEVRDEHGCLSRGGDEDYDGNGNESFRFDAFPRRGRWLKLVASTTNSGRAPAVFTLPNPDPGPHPSWIAHPPPDTQRDGDVAVTLTRFEARPRPAEFQPVDRYGWVCARFQISKGGRPAPGWRIWPLGFSSAAGDRWHMEGNDVSQDRTAQPFLAFGTEKWPDEPVWKISMNVSTDRGAPWSPSEVWNVPSANLPTPGVSIPLTGHSKVEGVNVELIGLAGKGSRFPADPQDAYADISLPRLRLRVDWSTGHRPCDVFVYTRDESGELREASGRLDNDEESESAAQTANSLGTFSLSLPRRARKTDLLIVVHRRRRIDFLVPNPYYRQPGASGPP